jgi:aldehyde dehydrogenase (NAD+)
VFASVPKGDKADAGLAMSAAFDARKAWASTPPLERAGVLFKAAGILQESMQDYLGVLVGEGGSTFGKAMFEIFQTVDLLNTAAGDCKAIRGETFQTDPGDLKRPAKTFERRREDENKAVIWLGNHGNDDIAFVR